MMALLPENALPYVVHMLAHMDTFEQDVPQYHNTHQYVLPTLPLPPPPPFFWWTWADGHRHLNYFFFDPLLQKADNFLFLIELLQFIKLTEDIQDPDSHVRAPRVFFF
jgi:hypothetical protein